MIRFEVRGRERRRHRRPRTPESCKTPLRALARGVRRTPGAVGSRIRGCGAAPGRSVVGHRPAGGAIDGAVPCPCAGRRVRRRGPRPADGSCPRVGRARRRAIAGGHRVRPRRTRVRAPRARGGTAVARLPAHDSLRRFSGVPRRGGRSPARTSCGETRRARTPWLPGRRCAPATVTRRYRCVMPQQRERERLPPAGAAQRLCRSRAKGCRRPLR